MKKEMIDFNKKIKRVKQENLATIVVLIFVIERLLIIINNINIIKKYIY